MEFRRRGYATLQVDSPLTGATGNRNTSGDTRTNQIWIERTGEWYTDLFPAYSRNNLDDNVSTDMIYAWTVTEVINALEKLVADTTIVTPVGGTNLVHAPGTPFRDIIDPTKLGVIGSSWAGKLAFAAGVFDERIGVTMPSVAGASGPEPWRLGYVGNARVYSWNTSYKNETLQQSVRHNRVREADFFRQFLTPWNYYVYIDENHWIPDSNGDLEIGMGNRLPYDKHEVVATIWPRAVIDFNVVNDYNDGAETDAISLQVAKSVPRKLGATVAGDPSAQRAGLTADDLFKFNIHPYVPPPADPHGGQEAWQYARGAEYMDWYFYGTPMSDTTAAFLNNDPFEKDVLVPGGSTSYERNFGGLKEIAPWFIPAAE
jgi:hypothetical protein